MSSALPAETTVLIAGAGPVGLVTSILLSREGIPNVVVEKRECVSTLPRARGITARTVEILTQLGLAADLDDMALQEPWIGQFVYTETLAGRLIGKMPSGPMLPGALRAWSPIDYKVAAQDRIDPMLFRRASREPLAAFHFNTEVVGYLDDADGIVASVRSSDGTVSEIRCRYLVAADGAKSPLRAMAGIGTVGQANLRSFVNNHLRADLSRYTAGREGALIWTLAPGVEGVFQMLDGKSHWAVQIQYDPTTESVEDWTPERVRKQLLAMIGDPSGSDVEIDVLRTYTYTLSTMISERLRSGRLLLVGDAAHQVPPYGGFGLNTGIQSAHNLAWKLAAVLRGEAGEDLLDTFDCERREVAARVCTFGRTNAGYIERMMAALRSPGAAEDKSAIIKSSKQYGNWNGLDLGVHYEGDGAFVPDDVPPPVVADPVVDYVPHAKPGQRAPHAFVWRGNERISTIMLFDRFVLLAGPEGEEWIDAARNAVVSRPAIAAYRVASGGDLRCDEDFCTLYGITPSGAVLVRPDGHVAYRAQTNVPDATAALNAALDATLRRAAVAP